MYPRSRAVMSPVVRWIWNEKQWNCILAAPVSGWPEPRAVLVRAVSLELIAVREVLRPVLRRKAYGLAVLNFHIWQGAV